MIAPSFVAALMPDRQQQTKREPLFPFISFARRPWWRRQGHTYCEHIETTVRDLRQLSAESPLHAARRFGRA